MADFLAAAQFLVRKWWIVLGVTVLVVGAAAISVSFQNPVYEASTSVVIGLNEQIEGVRDTINSLRTLQRRDTIATYSKLPSSDVVRALAHKALGISENIDAAYTVSTHVLPDTDIFRITVAGPDPQITASLAKALVVQTRILGEELYRLYAIKTLDSAEVPSHPVRPRVERTLVTAGIAGLLLGIGLSFLIGEIGRVRSQGEDDFNSNAST